MHSVMPSSRSRLRWGWHERKEMNKRQTSICLVAAVMFSVCAFLNAADLTKITVEWMAMAVVFGLALFLSKSRG